MNRLKDNLMSRKPEVIGFALCLCFFLIGTLLYGGAQLQTVPLSVRQGFGMVFLLVSFIGALWGWGGLLEKFMLKTRTNLALQLALGVFALSSIVFVLGVFRLLYFNYYILQVVLLFSGYLAYLWFDRDSSEPKAEKTQGWEKKVLCGIFGFLAFLVLGYTILAFQLFQHWDPLWYHLSASRSWVDNGAIRYPYEALINFHAAVWEQLYVWSHLLLGAPNAKGLHAAQIFSQWLHVLLGCGGTLLAVRWLIGSFFKKENGWMGVALVWVIGCGMLQFTTTLAKSDWGLAFLFLSGFNLLILDRKLMGRNLLCAGILIGFACSGKWSLLAVAMPLLVFRCCEIRDKKLIGILAGGLFLGALPMLARNGFLLHNPVFPAMTQWLGRDKIGPTWPHAYFVTQHTPLMGSFLSRLWVQLSEVFHSSYVLILVPAAFYFAQKRVRNLMVSLIFTLPLLFCVGGETSLFRWVAPTFLLLIVFTVMSTGEYLQRYSTRVQKIGMLLLLWFGIITFHFPQGQFPSITMRFPLGQLLKMPSLPNTKVQLESHRGGKAWSWIRGQGLQGEERVLVLLDTRMYYALDLHATRIWDSRATDWGFLRAPALLPLVKLWSELDYRYLVDTNESIDKFFNAEILMSIRRAYDQCKQCIVYQDKESRVVDLEIWYRGLMKLERIDQLRKQQQQGKGGANSPPMGMPSMGRPPDK